MLINQTKTGFKRANRQTNLVALVLNILKDICGMQMLDEQSWLSIAGLFSRVFSSVNRSFYGMDAKETLANRGGAFINAIILGNLGGQGLNALISSDLNVGARDRCQGLHPTNVLSQAQIGEPSNYRKGLEPKQFLRSGWYAHLYDDILYDGIYGKAPT